MIKINNVELEFDLLEADTAEAYDEALKKIANIKEDVKGMSVGKSIRYQCNAIFDLFNTLFGEGTDTEIFGDKVNLGDCLEAFEILVNEANKQAEDMHKKYAKYTPNRNQRRAGK